MCTTYTLIYERTHLNSFAQNDTHLKGTCLSQTYPPTHAQPLIRIRLHLFTSTVNILLMTFKRKRQEKWQADKILIFFIQIIS